MLRIQYLDKDRFMRQVAASKGSVYLHLDNDKAGRLCTKTLKGLLGNDYEIVDDPPPIGKDFNDFLLSYLGISRQNNARDQGLFHQRGRPC